MSHTKHTNFMQHAAILFSFHHKRPENPVRATGLKWFATNTFRSICCHLRLFQIHPTRVPRLTLFRCRSFRFLVETIQEKIWKNGVTLDISNGETKPGNREDMTPSRDSQRQWDCQGSKTGCCLRCSYEISVRKFYVGQCRHCLKPKFQAFKSL